MVKREHLWLRRELLGIASSGVPGLSQRAKRTGNRHTADAILACMLAKIEGDAVQRALELAGVQFIDADDSGGEGVRLRLR